MQIEEINNKKKIGNNLPKRTTSRRKTGLDIAKEIKSSIQSEFPGMPDAYALNLAVFLTKEQLKNREVL